MASCISLRNGCLIVAILHMIVASLAGILIIGWMSGEIGKWAGVLTSQNIDNDLRMKTGELTGRLVGIAIALVLVCVGKFYLGLTLKKGVEKDDYKTCKFWLLATGLLFILNFIVLIGCETEWDNILGSVMYELTGMITVFLFMLKLKTEAEMVGYEKIEKSKAVQIEKA